MGFICMAIAIWYLVHLAPMPVQETCFRASESGFGDYVGVQTKYLVVLAHCLLSVLDISLLVSSVSDRK
jgi:hypothetical protein